MTTSILPDEILVTAFRDFTDRPGNIDRLKRWLWYPHSAEKWFEFEFLYTLDACLGAECRVAAQKKASTGEIPDLGIWHLAGTDEPLDQAALHDLPAAVIELKMIGNWYLASPTLPKIKQDVDKIQPGPSQAWRLSLRLLQLPR